MNRNAELKEYKRLLKENEAEINRLNGLNKHIKSHIKFLEIMGVEVEGVVPVTNTTFVENPIKGETLDEGSS